MAKHPESPFAVLQKDRAGQELAEKFAARYVTAVRTRLDLNDTYHTTLGYITFLLSAARAFSDQLRYALDMSDVDFVKFANRNQVEGMDDFGGILSR